MVRGGTFVRHDLRRRPLSPDAARCGRGRAAGRRRRGRRGRGTVSAAAAGTARANIEKSRVACNNCGATGGEVIARGRDHEYATTTSDTFDVVRCSCGLVYLDPRPAISELDTIYPNDYYAYRLLQRRQAAHGGDSLLARYMTGRIVHRLRAYAPRVLDERRGAHSPDPRHRLRRRGRCSTCGAARSAARRRRTGSR